MKLKVCVKKGKQAFRRAGYEFNATPVVIEVDDEDIVSRLKGEAMLIVEEVAPSKKKTKRKTRKKKSKKKK